ncbi:MAG: hypothetical protein Q7U57_00650 [Methylovulum sp.]|nr:hypothetical protein [Methylovulum sp.]
MINTADERTKQNDDTTIANRITGDSFSKKLTVTATTQLKACILDGLQKSGATANLVPDLINQG